MRKPRLFIASSVESLRIAEAVNVNLDHELEVTIWKNGTFKLSSTTIDDLVEKASSIDFALFIFAPDDIATIRDRNHHIVRDNVIFEMGLFVGAIGKQRSFILKPRNEDMHLPSDLLGITPADYEANRSDGDLISATNRACSLVKTEVARIGIINHVALSESRRIQANPPSYDLNDIDFQFLAASLRSQTSSPGGLSFYQIINGFNRQYENKLQISAIKLERMGLVEKFIAVDEQNGYDYYSYKVSEMGIDVLLKNESRVDVQDEPDEVIPF